jgi:two-component system, NarL family, sensor kinase
MIGKGTPMKDRRGFQILDGFRRSTGKPADQSAALASITAHNRNQSCACPLHEQGGSSLATALAASEQRLSNLLHDRSRIGRELHDSVLQALYAISVTLEQAPGLRRGATQVVACSHDQATNQLRTLIQDIRRMILRVECDNVVPFRLALELQALAQTVERASELRIRVWSDPAAEEVLTGEEAQELVIIAREALNNCVRHARATRVVIALQRIGSRVRLSICDNGSGFNVEHRSTKGIGFAQMEDRLRKIGGRLHVQSTMGQGTDIAADVYLEPILTTV